MVSKIKPSFINETAKFTVIQSRSELLDLLEKKRQKGEHCLSNLDLSSMEQCVNVNFDGFRLENVIFSRFNPNQPSKTLLFNLSFVGAYLKNVSFAQANLQQCNFDTIDNEANLLNYDKINNGNDTDVNTIATNKTCKTTLVSVDFFFCNLYYCRSCGSFIDTADFRYSHIADCSMREIEAAFCDFYFCSFEGSTNFTDSVFTDCSFTCANFEHNCIRLSNIPKGIIQEHSTIYFTKFIHAPNWIKYNPCGSFSSINHDANLSEITKKSESKIALEASNFYKTMSGMYSGKGLNRDSNEAYRLSKIYELKFYKLERKLPKKEREKESKHIFKKIMKLRLTQAFGYGYKWQAPTLWFIGIVATYGLIGILHEYLSNHVFVSEQPVTKMSNNIYTLCYSLYNSMAPSEKFIEIISLPWATFESVFGVLLIGFLGFIIANNIRNDS